MQNEQLVDSSVHGGKEKPEDLPMYLANSS